MTSFLASYRPLAISARGRLAAAQNNLPLYIDGSCRREPDFESAHPSITALCRAHMFAPRIRVGDDITYITVKSTFGARVAPHYRLVAYLRAVHLSSSHEEAAAWYRERSLPIPGNCMIAGNEPRPYLETSGRNEKAYRDHPEEVRLRWWDGEYRKRAKRIGKFVHCDPIFVELHNPPALAVTDFENIFRRMPGTRTPPELPASEMLTFVKLARSRVEA
jgi:hypothetical protein